MSVNMRIFLTGRPNVDDRVMECFGKVVRVPLSSAEDEMKGYLEMGFDYW